MSNEQLEMPVEVRPEVLIWEPLIHLYGGPRMLKTHVKWGPLRTIPMGLLVEFEVLLVDESVMRRQCGGGSTENLQTEPGPFLLIREQESGWERISKIRELGEDRELPEGHHQHEVLQRRGLGAGCLQSKWFQDSGRVEARGRQ